MTDNNNREAPSSPKKNHTLFRYSGILAVVAAAVGAHQLATCSSIDDVIDSPGKAANVDKKEQVPIIEKEESKQEPAPQSEKPVKLDVTKYVPPAELGVVVERKINPDSKKTVVYLPDAHAEMGSVNPVESETGIKTQYQLYKIVEDVLDRQSGPITLVIESWPEGKGAEYLRSLSVDATNHPEVVEVAHTEDRKERIGKANIYIGSTLSPAGDMLAAAYPERIVALGVENPEMERRRMISIEKYRALKMGIGEGALPCKMFDPNIKNGDLLIRDAFDPLNETSEGDKNSCVCKSLDFSFNLEKDVWRERLEVAEDEAKKGVSAKDEVVFIMAGAMHLNPSRAYFEKNNINYIVIAPKAVVDVLPTMKNLNTTRDRTDLPDVLKIKCRDTSVLSDAVYAKVIKATEATCAAHIDEEELGRVDK